MKIESIFQGVLTDDEIFKISSDVKSYGDVKLSQLGVDSIGLMSVVFNLEDHLQTEIDFEELRIEDFETINKIGLFIDGYDKGEK